MSEIQYNFSANNNSIETINSAIQQIGAVREDIGNLFNVLLTVYTGSGATAMNQAQQNIDSKLDDMLNNMTATQKQAAEQQATMQALDNANAAAF
jgi:prephenate dehydratase